MNMRFSQFNVLRFYLRSCPFCKFGSNVLTVGPASVHVLKYRTNAASMSSLKYTLQNIDAVQKHSVYYANCQSAHTVLRSCIQS